MDGGIGLNNWKKIVWNDTSDCFLFQPNAELTYIDNYENVEETLIQEKRANIEQYEKTCEKGAKKWEFYKKCINPYEMVYTTQPLFQEKNISESVCTLRPLSRSYFKMIEILEIVFNKYPSFYKNPRCFLHSAHVCEGPGGFIEGFVDFCHRKSYRPGCSRAITLCSNDYNIPGWKKAQHFLSKNKNVKLSYGKDGTGNILLYENQTNFINRCSPKADIFTGDGGFDFSSDYSSQESSIFPLLVSTVRIGMECLHKGGLFIMKLFDFYQKSTIDLLYFLSVHFKQWTIYKPAMSRPNNPENYFIGVDFLGCCDKNLFCIQNWSMDVCEPCHTIDFRKVQLYNQLPVPFMNYIRGIRSELFKLQIFYLNKAFKLIDNDTVNTNTVLYDTLTEGVKNSIELCTFLKVPILAEFERMLTEV